MTDQSPQVTPDASASDTALHRLGRILRRRWLVVVLAAVVVPAATMAVTLSMQKKYTASATLLIRPTGSQTLFQQTPVLPSSSDEEREAATQADLATVPAVAVDTSKQLGGRVSAGQIANDVSIGSSQSSNVFHVNATDPNPRLAQRIANSYARKFIDFRSAANKAKLQSLSDAIGRRLIIVRKRLGSLRIQLASAGGTEAQVLRSRIHALRDEQAQILERQSELSSTASVDTSDIEFVQGASLPGSPSSPKPLRNLVLSLVLGLILGLALAGLFDLIDRRIKDPKE